MIDYDENESAQNQLQHVGIWTGWICFSSNGTNASGNSNLALGNAGPDAIAAYIWDFGGNNYEVGHRRWILYPQTQIMATGDVPAEGTNNSANATWVFPRCSPRMCREVRSNLPPPTAPPSAFIAS